MATMPFAKGCANMVSILSERAVKIANQQKIDFDVEGVQGNHQGISKTELFAHVCLLNGHQHIDSNTKDQMTVWHSEVERAANDHP